MPAINADTIEFWKDIAVKVSAQRPDPGRVVKVTGGRKHQGRMGKVIRHQVSKYRDPFRYASEAQAHLRQMTGRTGYVCLVEDHRPEHGERVMARLTPFSVGRRWYCARDPKNNPYNRPNFWFVIVGPPTYEHNNPKTYKACRIEIEGAENMPAHHLERNGHGQISDYSHKHLKKCAVLEPVEIRSGCQNLRRVLLRHGLMINMVTGETKTENERQEWVTMTCGGWIYDGAECNSCREGWKHPENYPAHEPRPEKEIES